DGGPAASAGLVDPAGIDLAPDGSLYVADYGGHRIRRIRPDGTIETVAGSGVAGYSGDGGPATAAELNKPMDVAVAPDGSYLIVADGQNSRLRILLPDGTIGTLATDPVATEFPYAVAIAPDGTIWYQDRRGLRRIAPLSLDPGAAQIRVPSEDGDELYVFDRHGRHLRTLSTLTGAELRRFERDADGRLLRIVEGDGRATRIERDASGRPVAIVSPDGHRTALATDADGWLARVTDPAGGVWRFAYRAGGLLTRLTDPHGHVSEKDYDARGRLILDRNARGGTIRLRRRPEYVGAVVEVDRLDGTRAEHRIVGGSWGAWDRWIQSWRPGSYWWQLLRFGPWAEQTEHYGYLERTEFGPDPRFGPLARLRKGWTVQWRDSAWYGTVASSTAVRTRSAVLADPADPMSLQRLTDEWTIDGEVWRRTFDAATRTFEWLSPEGRRIVERVDALERPVERRVGALAPLTFAYDASGRLVEIARDDGATRRAWRLGYGPDGWLARVTDPLGREIRLERDAAGRIVRQVLPDGREVRFAYDAGGNLVEIVPPGRPPHRFAYDALDQPARYEAPDAGGGAVATHYELDAARRPVRVVRPGGETVRFSYDAATGLLDRLTLPDGSEVSYAYGPMGRVQAVRTTWGVRVGIGYMGDTPARMRWEEGPVLGMVEHRYGTGLRLVQTWVSTPMSVGVEKIAFRHDRDGLIAGADVAGQPVLELERDAGAGLVTGSVVGEVQTRIERDAFGDVSRIVARSAASVLERVSVVRNPTRGQPLRVTGRVANAARVVVGGLAVPVAADGTFDAEVPVPAPAAGSGTVSLMVEVYDASGALAVSRSVGLYVEEPVTGVSVQGLAAVAPDGGVYFLEDAPGSGGRRGSRVAAGGGAPERPAWLDPEVVDVALDGAGRVWHVRAGSLRVREGGAERVVADVSALGDPVADLAVGPGGVPYLAAGGTVWRYDEAVGGLVPHVVLPAGEWISALAGSSWGLVLVRVDAGGSGVVFEQVAADGSRVELFRDGGVWDLYANQ
ncbi:MAG TPA: hypothetical protein ENK20_06575, partial [Chromatiales bacterium]|nr:hypothetical protein [Chromatiales bacterium]